MKGDATLEDILDRLRDKQCYVSMYFVFKKELYIEIWGGVPFNLDLVPINSKKYSVYWQLNAPFSEQGEKTKSTLNKIL